MPSVVDVDNPYGIELYSVDTPNGSNLNLLNEDEARYYESQRDKYLSDNRFTNVSDIEDLSRLLVLEVMVRRWSTYLAQGFDYLAARINETECKSNIKEYSTEIRLVKASLGIDRAQREKDKGETVGDYVATLLARAKAFGVHRNQQYAKSVTFLWELINQVQTYDRCNDDERRELDLTPESILDWVRSTVIPEWAALNNDFRQQQRIWIGDL